MVPTESRTARSTQTNDDQEESEDDDERKPALRESLSAPEYELATAVASSVISHDKVEESKKGATEPSQMVAALQRFPLSGHLITFLCSIMFAVCAALVKSLTEVDPFLVACVRSVFVFLFALPVVVRNESDFVPEGSLGRLILRVICGSVNLTLMYYSFRHLPLGDCRMISATSPVFVTILARMFLHEACGLFEVVNILVTLTGVVIVMQPPFIFGSLENGIKYGNEHFTTAVVALIGTLFAAGSVTAVRSLKNVDVFVISTWNGFFGIFPPLIICLILGAFEVPSLRDRLLLFLLSVISFFGQIMMAVSLKLEEAGSISLARKSEDIVLAFLTQVVFFNEVPSWLTVLGATIISLCVFVTAVRKLVMLKASQGCRLRTFLCLPLQDDGEEPSQDTKQL